MAVPGAGRAKTASSTPPPSRAIARIAARACCLSGVFVRGAMALDLRRIRSVAAPIVATRVIVAIAPAS